MNKQCKVKGKILFQANPINLSYRQRGKVPRNHNTKQIKIPTFIKNSNERLPPKNKITITVLIKIIMEYSPKNNKAKPPALYSTLKPDTNSDSPSAKSNGVRFISAIQDTTQTTESK